MIITRLNKYGIENNIHRVQRELQNRLTWITTVGTANVLIYGMIYPNSTPIGIQPETFSSGKEYVNGLSSDKTSCQIAFNVLSTTGSSITKNDAEIDIIFTANINSIYNNDDYETERAIGESKYVLENVSCLNEFVGIKRGVRQVFAGFDLTGIEYNDMSPNYVWALTYRTSYIFDINKTRVTQDETTLFTADSTITVDNNTITIDQLLI